MKKYLLLLLASFLFLSTNAQEVEEEHMQFMGISMGLPIKEFHRQLIKTGFKTKLKHSTFKSYDGFFAGRDAQVTAYFNDKTKLISFILVSIQCYEEKIANDTYRNFCDIIEKKYINDDGVQFWIRMNEHFKDDIKKGEATSLDWKQVKENEGVEETYFLIPRPIRGEPLNLLGTILIKTKKELSLKSFDYDHLVQIVYCDNKNNKINNNLNNSDF